MSDLPDAHKNVYEHYEPFTYLNAKVITFLLLISENDNEAHRMIDPNKKKSACGESTEESTRYITR